MTWSQARRRCRGVIDDAGHHPPRGGDQRVRRAGVRRCGLAARGVRRDHVRQFRRFPSVSSEAPAWIHRSAAIRPQAPRRRHRRPAGWRGAGDTRWASAAFPSADRCAPVVSERDGDLERQVMPAHLEPARLSFFRPGGDVCIDRRPRRPGSGPGPASRGAPLATPPARRYGSRDGPRVIEGSIAHTGFSRSVSHRIGPGPAASVAAGAGPRR